MLQECFRCTVHMYGAGQEYVSRSAGCMKVLWIPEVETAGVQSGLTHRLNGQVRELALLNQGWQLNWRVGGSDPYKSADHCVGFFRVSAILLAYLCAYVQNLCSKWLEHFFSDCRFNQSLWRWTARSVPFKQSQIRASRLDDNWLFCFLQLVFETMDWNTLIIVTDIWSSVQNRQSLLEMALLILFPLYCFLAQDFNNLSQRVPHFSERSYVCSLR